MAEASDNEHQHEVPYGPEFPPPPLTMEEYQRLQLLERSAKANSEIVVQVANTLRPLQDQMANLQLQLQDKKRKHAEATQMHDDFQKRVKSDLGAIHSLHKRIWSIDAA